MKSRNAGKHTCYRRKTSNIEVQNVQNQEPNGKEVSKQRIKISPVAKKIAKSENLDIKALVGIYLAEGLQRQMY